jgi:hypothetical protein
VNALSRLSTALRTVAAAALVVLAGSLPVRWIESALNPFEPYPGHTAPHGIARSRAIRSLFPEIAGRDEKTVIVLGSSGVARAFVPSVFDAALAGGGKRYVSYNLAQMLLQPETSLAMAKVVRHAYAERHKRLAMAIFGISVPELNHDSVRAAQRNMPDQPFTFANWETLAEQMHTDPLGALSDGLFLLFFGNIRLERVRLWLDDWISARPVGCDSGLKQPPDGDDELAVLTDYCAELHRQFPVGLPPWNPTSRGALDFGLPATRPMLERLVEMQARDLPPQPQDAPARAGVVRDIDEESIRTLIAAVRELKSVSDVTFVLRDISNPALLAPVPAEQRAYWREVAERIAREGDAVLLDLNDGALAAADFLDRARTHVNPLAAERVSAVLAARVGPIVQEHRASR